jgi:class 3 adenylate cyclase
LAPDVAGYSRLMGTDERGTLEALKAHRREVVDPAIASYKGRIVKTTGDGMLVEFASAVDAVTCAMSVRGQMAQRNDGKAPKIAFRIGINVGDIIIDGDDIFGDGVNVAARVENECEAGLEGDARGISAGRPFLPQVALANAAGGTMGLDYSTRAVSGFSRNSTALPQFRIQRKGRRDSGLVSSSPRCGKLWLDCVRSILLSFRVRRVKKPCRARRNRS